MNKLQEVLRVFKKGNAVENPTKWKNIQINTTILASFLIAIVNAFAVFGYSIPIDVDAANNIAGAFVAVFNLILTVSTSEKVGIGEKDATK